MSRRQIRAGLRVDLGPWSRPWCSAFLGTADAAPTNSFRNELGRPSTVPNRTLAHEAAAIAPEVHARLVFVVGSTPQLDVRHRSRTAQGVGMPVMELQEAALRAAPAGRTHERAAPQIAQPDRALHLGRDVPGSRCRAGRGAWPLGCGEFLLREVGEERGESTVQDGSFVSRRHGMAEQVLRETELLERVAADRDLDPIAVR